MNYKDGVKALFENLRNLTVCALLIAAGLYETTHSSGLPAWLGIDVAVGWGLVTIGSALTVVNLLVGLSQLSKLDFSRIFMALLCSIYVIASVRMVVVLTSFRVT